MARNVYECMFLLDPNSYARDPAGSAQKVQGLVESSGGKILASLALDSRDEWSQCGLVTQKPLRLPPEPIRYAGGRMVREAVRRKDLAEASGQEPSRAMVWLASLAPAGLEDKSNT